MAPRYSTPILLTGISSYVGSAAAAAALKRGYKVRGTVRSQAKADDVARRPDFVEAVKSGQLTFAIVEDLITGDFSEALEGVEAVIHVASPFHLHAKNIEEEYLKPAIEGTLNLFRAAKKAGTVKHIVLTSSFAANLDLADSKFPYNGKVYTDKDWNPVTYQEAKESDHPAFGYSASKLLSEKAAWDFVEKEGKGIKLSTLCPPMVFGPSLVLPNDLSRLNESVEQINDLISGKFGEEVPPTGFPGYTDVRDLAEAHVAAIDKDVRGRFCIYNGSYDNQRVLDLAHKLFPEQLKGKAPVGKPGTSYTDKSGLFSLDNTKAKEELGVHFRGFDETFGDMLTQLVKAH